MSKICIIGTSNIKHISLISLYTRFYEKNGIDYDIIYIDRYGIDEQTGAKQVFKFRLDNMNSRFGKLSGFIKFRSFVKRKVKENSYDLLITWQSTTAYILSDFLLRKYKKKYIVNIRDYIAENNPLFKCLLSRLVDKSAFTTISSDGFLEFLPAGKYIKVNSINEDLFADIKVHTRVPRIPYKIGFVGNCRYFKESFRLIDALANDKRFELWYCGTNSAVIKEYAVKNNIENVYTLDSFAPEETVQLMSRFDIINSAFGSDAFDNRTLMPIRLYTAAAMNLPVLASNNTKVGSVISEYNIGFVVKSYDSLPDTLADYFVSLDKKELSASCEAFLSVCRKENARFYQNLRKIAEE